MRIRHGISRRHMLAMSAAAGGMAMGMRGASAQVEKKIEQLDPALDKIIATSEPIKELASGFGGTLGPAEGPLWWKEGGYLLFTDIHNNKRMKYTPGQGVTVDLEPTNRANGLTRDQQGRLLSCEHDSRRVTRRELDGSLTVLANSFQGRRLNRPNDVVVKSDGAHLLHRSLEQPGGARAVGPDLLGRLPAHARSRHAQPADRQFRVSQRARLLARRAPALRQRFPARPHPRVRGAAQRHARQADPTGCSPTCAAASRACPTA